MNLPFLFQRTFTVVFFLLFTCICFLFFSSANLVKWVFYFQIRNITHSLYNPISLDSWLKVRKFIEKLSKWAELVNNWASLTKDAEVLKALWHQFFMKSVFPERNTLQYFLSWILIIWIEHLERYLKPEKKVMCIVIFTLLAHFLFFSARYFHGEHLLSLLQTSQYISSARNMSSIFTPELESTWGFNSIFNTFSHRKFVIFPISSSLPLVMSVSEIFSINSLWCNHFGWTGRNVHFGFVILTKLFSFLLFSTWNRFIEWKKKNLETCFIVSVS